MIMICLCKWTHPISTLGQDSQDLRWPCANCSEERKCSFFKTFSCQVGQNNKNYNNFHSVFVELELSSVSETNSEKVVYL